MDSRPSAKRAAPSGEKTGVSSRSSDGRRAAPQSVLSRPASRTITSQTERLGAEEVSGGLQRPVDLRVAVRRRDEHRLELRGRDVDAALEQVAEESAEAPAVARGCLAVVTNRALAEEDCDHRADPLDADTVGSQAFLDPGAGALELCVDLGLAEAPQDDERGRRRERVPGERARLVDRAGRRELVHYVAATAEGGQRQAPADDLAEHGQVRRDAVALLRAPARDPKSGDDLVKDEERAARVR